MSVQEREQRSYIRSLLVGASMAAQLGLDRVPTAELVVLIERRGQPRPMTEARDIEVGYYQKALEQAAQRSVL